jgi:hypothetical protein
MESILEFFQTPAGIFTGLALLFFAGLGLFVVLREARGYIASLQGDPRWGPLADFLLPAIDQCIVAAFQAGEWAADEFGERLKGLDKKVLADALYGILPDEISIGPLKWNWKNYVSKEQFAIFVQKRFDELNALWDENSQAILDWLKRPSEERVGLIGPRPIGPEPTRPAW